MISAKKRKILALAATGILVLGIGIWKVAAKLYAVKRGEISGNNGNRQNRTTLCATPGFSDTDCVLDQGKNKQKNFIIGSGGFYY